MATRLNDFNSVLAESRAFVAEWTVDEVIQFLQDSGMSHLQGAFADHDVDGPSFLGLTLLDLERMGATGDASDFRTDLGMLSYASRVFKGGKMREEVEDMQREASSSDPVNLVEKGVYDLDVVLSQIRQTTDLTSQGKVSTLPASLSRSTELDEFDVELSRGMYDSEMKGLEQDMAELQTELDSFKNVETERKDLEDLVKSLRSETKELGQMRELQEMKLQLLNGTDAAYDGDAKRLPDLEEGARLLRNARPPHSPPRTFTGEGPYGDDGLDGDRAGGGGGVSLRSPQTNIEEGDYDFNDGELDGLMKELRIAKIGREEMEASRQRLEDEIKAFSDEIKNDTD
jgi:hypothetical protein